MKMIYRLLLGLGCVVLPLFCFAQQPDSISTDTLDLPEIKVSSELLDQKIERSTISLQTLDAKQLDRMVSTDPISALQLMPGLTIYDEQPSIRGSSGYTFGAGTRVLTMLNGLPLLSPDLNAASFDLLPMDAVKQIEVMKGAASVLYGSGALGGVIHMITEKPSTVPYTQIRSTFRLYDRPANRNADWDGFRSASVRSVHALHSRRVNDRYGFLVLADLIDNTGFRKDENERRARIWFMQDYNRKLNDKYYLRVSLNTLAHFDSSGAVIAWGGYPDSALIAGPGFLSKQYTFNLAIDPTIQLFKGNQIHTLQGRFYNVNQRVSTGQNSRSYMQYVDYKYQAPLYKKWIQLATGLNYTGTQVFSDSTFGRATGRQAAAFAQFQLAPTEKLQFLLGARWQYEDVRGDTARLQANKGQSPLERRETLNRTVMRIGGNYEVAKATFLRASWGQAVRSPSVAERFTTTQSGGLTVLPNPEIAVEKGWTAEIGLRQGLKWGRLQAYVDVSAFRMQFEDMVEFWVVADQLGRVPGFPFRAQNISEARVDGMEFSTQGRFRAAKRLHFGLIGGITVIDPIDLQGNARYDGDEKYQEVILLGIALGQPDRPRTLKYRNKVLIRTSPSVEWRKWNLSCNYTYNSPIVNIDKIFLQSTLLPDVYNFRKEHNKGWHVVDVILSWSAGQQSWSLAAYNLLNEEFMTVPGTLGAQRSFALQWKLRF